MVTSAYDASMYNSTSLGAYAASSSLVFVRDTANVLDATLEDATNLGTLKTDYSQLDVTSSVRRENTENYYKFTLDGDNAKFLFKNNTSTSDLRVQLMNSDGEIIADSSTYADEDLQTAYAAFASSKGLDIDAGDYYVKVTFDAVSKKSVEQQYSFALYSGNSFNVSYQTSATTQIDREEKVVYDNTMTYSLIDALEYSAQQTHLATETAESAISIGWLAEDKTALKVTGQMTWVCDEQYYAVTLQDGDSLKMAFTNKTDTSDLRIQIYNSTGTFLLADSQGDEELLAAYNALASSDGMTVDPGSYIVKISYANGEKKSDQLYSFYLYAGDVYDTLYETETTTETAATAILNGDLTEYADARAVSASYLASSLSEDLDDVFSVLKDYAGYV